MRRKRHKPEEIVTKLWQVDVIDHENDWDLRRLMSSLPKN